MLCASRSGSFSRFVAATFSLSLVRWSAPSFAYSSHFHLDGSVWIGFDSAKLGLTLLCWNAFHWNVLAYCCWCCCCCHCRCSVTDSCYIFTLWRFIWIPFVRNHWMHFVLCSYCEKSVAPSCTGTLCMALIQCIKRRLRIYERQFLYQFIFFCFFCYHCHCCSCRCLSILLFSFSLDGKVSKWLDFANQFFFSISLLTVYQPH